MNLLVYLSNNDNVYHNIAVECVLAKNCAENTQILYLWSNDSAVVIGKHQLPSAECDCNALLDDGGKLARRLSGGGAVYHDINNLCYSFICREKEYNQSDNYKIIINALDSLGISASVSGRNDIETGGKKFSGNAFYTSGGVKVHHGTILINTDTNKLQKYLKPNPQKLSHHAVVSVGARVVNLVEIDRNITKDAVCAAIIDSAEKFWGKGKDITFENGELGLIKNYEILLSSNKWLYGFGKYQNVKSKLFDWGNCEVHYSVEKGEITDLNIVTDCLDAELIDEIKNALLGRKLPLDKKDNIIYNDIVSLVK